MKYPVHTTTQFDVELKAVCASVLQMGTAVENQFRLTLDFLETGDVMTIDRVISEGQEINSMEIEIDERCTNILVRRQPTANDLRLVTTIIKTINDLERIGDEAESIALVSKQLDVKYSTLFPRYHQIKYMGGVANEMLGSALEAFENMDSDAARIIVRKDGLIDDEFRTILRHLVANMMEDNSDLSSTLNAVLVARAIERIGDHAKNISKHVIYMMEGREVRNNKDN